MDADILKCLVGIAAQRLERYEYVVEFRETTVFEGKAYAARLKCPALAQLN